MNCLQVLQLWNFSQLEAQSTQRSDHGIFQLVAANVEPQRDAATCQTLNQSALRKRALVGCPDPIGSWPKKIW